MVRVQIEGGQPCYTWVDCLVSGTLSGTTAAATVSSVNPIYLTPNMSVYTLDTSVSPPVFNAYANPDTAVLIQSNLKGTITVTFPETTSCTGTVTAAPLWTWIYNNQYISVAYNPYTMGCKP
jgi:Na+-driven multidrug efflux pump